jgi:flagellum-specific ATP synthase
MRVAKALIAQQLPLQYPTDGDIVATGLTAVKDFSRHQVLNDLIHTICNTEVCDYSGRIVRVRGAVIEATGVHLPIGSQCCIELASGQITLAEVAGFEKEFTLLIPQSGTDGIDFNSRILLRAPIEPCKVAGHFTVPREQSAARHGELPVGDALLGRVLDGAGAPIDRKKSPLTTDYRRLNPDPINPLAREPIKSIMDVGVCAINSMLTIGRGQRVGIFAGSGVGKSVLLGMMARHTRTDIVVICLIGERGREVREFIDDILDPITRERCIVVAAPADSSPLMRVQAAKYACTISEYFRDQGRHVLLIMDSLTRYAMAHREIALSLGETPATKGYPVSVFAKLPALVERAGNGLDGIGSITAFYTVLTEGDDQQDPIADSARAILDGHIVLDRALAESGHYPAIDLNQSISRVMNSLVSEKHKVLALRLKQLSAVYKKNSDLISIGAYSPGNDVLLDEAIKLQARIQNFLQQDYLSQVTVDSSLEMLEALFNSTRIDAKL